MEHTQRGLYYPTLRMFDLLKNIGKLVFFPCALNIDGKKNPLPSNYKVEVMCPLKTSKKIPVLSDPPQALQKLQNPSTILSSRGE